MKTEWKSLTVDGASRLTTPCHTKNLRKAISKTQRHACTYQDSLQLMHATKVIALRIAEALTLTSGGPIRLPTLANHLATSCRTCRSFDRAARFKEVVHTTPDREGWTHRGPTPVELLRYLWNKKRMHLRKFHQFKFGIEGL
ncbi:uncharacterized protein LACBIDRAFT_318254 [Laccaria bicolor S238N-H82]|uniref:Predicted protein n=1 Tax=Laccaria bicolor (strain S238N-H82 / ATCC MYA-4686) TaxID=486041 RepID=B0D6A9_LACBS|nr:uncharacterized protein LACBIDRAFT_318254 [Laccaria bicolor S238N-H82]EDR09915.1 predicted protein [Laccaria bicolor S238N-H82]|eukprot:XP_001879300.1 predicted protein [Laccaria bicolor S238N-H82]